MPVFTVMRVDGKILVNKYNGKKQLNSLLLTV